MRLEGKRDSLILFFIVVWLPSVLLFSLKSVGLVSDYIQATFYIIGTVACLSLLGTLIKSDDQYYSNLGLQNFFYAIMVALLMISLSWGLSITLNNASLLSVSYSLNLVVAPSSLLTILISLLLFGLVMAATTEELIRLTLFAELKERVGHKWYGIFLYAGFPTLFWAILHGIQAYTNLFLIFPALVNGVILLVFLWWRKCILACILSHWMYNGTITLLTFVNGKANINPDTPLLPDLLTPNPTDYALILIMAVAVAFFIMIPMLSRKHQKT